MTTRAASPTWAVVLAGLLSLAAAMGIGRFAFTPVLPLLLREGSLDVGAGGWLAAANYLGYFAGALTAARLPLGARTLGTLALGLTALATAAMALPGVALWVGLRFVAGVASAWVFVATSVWCLGTLAARGASRHAGWVYAGVGTGIAGVGLYCLAAGAAGVASAALWLHLGVLAAVLAVPVLLVSPTLATPPAAAAGAAKGASAPRELRGLVLSYGAMGFGYILPATFLPVLARSVVDDPRWFGLAWPVFGVTAALSTLAAGWCMARFSRLRVWAVSQLLMAAGVLLPALWLHGVTVAVSALLVGGTFMVITLAGVQEMRARAPERAAQLVGRITAAFALGQIAGPVASALLFAVPALRERGLAIALEIAALVLAASGLWLWRHSRPSTLQEPLHA